MTDFAATRPLGEVHKALCNLFNAQMKLGLDLLTAFTGLSVPCLPKPFQQTGCHTRTGCQTRAGCCEIPPPCWVPRSLGECVSHVCPCQTACIRLVLTNCDAGSRRVIRVEAAGPHVKVSPAKLVLEPLERASVEIRILVPAETKPGEKLESVVRIYGCREYYLRWVVSVGTIGFNSHHEIEVEDCPDLIHHWYDHFYCHRPCRHQQTPSPLETPSHG
jgi:hypothetical protein